MEDQLLKFQDLLHIASFFMDVVRGLAFGLLKGIAWCVDSLSGWTKEVYKLINFYNYAPVREFVDQYKPAIWALATIAVAFFGYQLMSSQKLEKHKTINNIILAMTIFILLPWGLEQGAGLVNAGKDLMTNKQTASTATFKANVTDLYKVDKNGWKSTDVQNDIKEKQDVKLLDIGEKVDTKSEIFRDDPLSKDGKELLTKKLVKVDGKYEAIKMKSFWKIGDPTYYRYSWHPWLITIEFCAKLLVYAFVIFKSARLINELGILYVFTTGIALTDIKDGQRNKQLVTKIRDTLIILYSVMLLINMFDLWSAFVGQADISKPLKAICVAAGAWLVIDGPNFFEQLFGIDAGLSSVGRSVTGFVQGGIAAKSLGSGIKKGVTNAPKATYHAARKLTRAGSYAGAAIKGGLSGFKPSKPEIPSDGDPNKNNPLKSKNHLEDTPPKEPLKQEERNPKSKEGAPDNKFMAGNQENKQKLGKKASPPTLAKNKAQVKAMPKPKPPMSNMNAVAQRNKEKLAAMGIATKKPLSNMDSGSKAQKMLETGRTAPPVPTVESRKLPQAIQEAKQNFMNDQKPRTIDTESLGDKVVNAYAAGAKRVEGGTTVRRTRKVYDVSKATTKRVSNKFKD